MLELAAHPDLELARVSGTTLPFDRAAFDAAVATQAYEFVEDLPAALAELYRVLRPNGGRALILDTDWDSIVWRSRDDGRMQRVLDGRRQRVAHPRLPRELAGYLHSAGFVVRDCRVFVILDREGKDGSYSVLQIDHLGASATGVPQSEVEEWAADLRELARAGEYFFSLNRYLFLATKR